MISILICSVSNTLLENIKKNISETIGFQHEIIFIENKKSKSIFWIYNQLIKQAKGDILCFVHEDVKFHTPNWGQALQQIFDRDKGIGLVGILGSTYKSSIPSSWNFGFTTEYSVGQIIQNNKVGTLLPKVSSLGFDNNQNQILVTGIDGVFMAMTSKIKDKVSFNNKLEGFHAYDADISMSVIASGHKVIVTNEILLEHFSEGSPNKQWLVNHLKTVRKWHRLLPLHATNNSYQNNIIIDTDIKIQNEFKGHLERMGFSFAEKIRYIWKFKTKHTQKLAHTFIKQQILIFLVGIKNIIKFSY